MTIIFRSWTHRWGTGESCTSLIEVSCHIRVLSLSCGWGWWEFGNPLLCTCILPISQLASLAFQRVTSSWQRVPTLLHFTLSRCGMRIQIISVRYFLLYSLEASPSAGWYQQTGSESIQQTLIREEDCQILLKASGRVPLCGMCICDTKRISPITCHLRLQGDGLYSSQMQSSPSKKNPGTRSFPPKAFLKRFLLKNRERHYSLTSSLEKNIHKAD